MRFDLLDGFRGAAALAVLVYHALVMSGAQHLMPLGVLAVDFFFCLSGFVICHAYENRLKAGLSLSDFLRARILRLYPMIFFGLIIGLASFFLRGGSGGGGVFLAFLLNGILLPSPFLPLGYDAAWPFNGPQWSLSFEIVVNIIYAAFGFKFRAAFLRVFLLAAAIVFAFAVFRKGGVDIGWHFHDAHYGIVRVVFPFFLGLAVYKFRMRLVKGVALSLWVSLALMLLLVVCFFMPILIRGGWTELFFVFVAFPVLIYFGACFSFGLVGAGVCRWLGYISYPVYATHYPVLKVAQAISAHEAGLSPVFIYSASIFLSVVIAWFLSRWLEEPLRRFLSRVVF